VIPTGELLAWVEGRNSDTSELTLKVEGETKLRCGLFIVCVCICVYI